MSEEKADSFTTRFNDIIPKINPMIGTRRKWLGQIREEAGSYLVGSDEDTDE